MLSGIVNLFCPICGNVFRFDQRRCVFYHHKYFGVLCSPACFEAGQNKYARIILGKDEDEPR